MPEIYKILDTNKNIQKIILIGESGHEIYERYNDSRFTLAESLEEAVHIMQESAENIAHESGQKTIALMSPSAASFDMFNDVYDRGTQFTELIKSLK